MEPSTSTKPDVSLANTEGSNCGEPRAEMSTVQSTAMRMESILKPYNMTHKTRGRCIIICHSDFRESKYRDLSDGRLDEAKELADCFSLVGFEDIRVYTDDEDALDDADKYFSKFEPHTLKLVCLIMP